MADDKTPPAIAQQKRESEKRDAVLRESYTEATKQLRANHLAEFNKIRQDLAKAAGVDWEIPLTAEQQAEKELAALLTAHPELVDKVTTLAPKVDG